MARPKTGDTRKMVTLPAELAHAIEDYRFAQRIKTEAEAIRRLIEAGLKAGEQIAIRGTEPGADGGSDPEANKKPAATGKVSAQREKKTGVTDRFAIPTR